MNWRKAAEEELRRYRKQKDSLDNLRERMAALAMKSRAVKVSCADVTPVHGGGSRQEDSLLDNIVERECLRHTYRAVNSLVRLTEHVLEGLDARERRALELFYIERKTGDVSHVERLSQELRIEKSAAYKLKDAALYKYTICMYGLVEY